MHDRYLPTCYKNVKWSEVVKDTISKMYCILCRKEICSNTSQHTCSSRVDKEYQLLIISSKQPSIKINSV